MTRTCMRTIVGASSATYGLRPAGVSASDAAANDNKTAAAAKRGPFIVSPIASSSRQVDRGSRYYRIRRVDRGLDFIMISLQYQTPGVTKCLPYPRNPPH